MTGQIQCWANTVYSGLFWYSPNSPNLSFRVELLITALCAAIQFQLIEVRDVSGSPQSEVSVVTVDLECVSYMAYQSV